MTDWSEFDTPSTAPATAPPAPTDPSVFDTGTPDKWAAFEPVGGTPSAELFARAHPALSAYSGGSRPPDIYEQAAIAERDRRLAQGRSLDEGYTHRLAEGVTFGVAPKVIGAAAAPIEMAKHGTWDPREGYRYAKAALDLQNAAARENTGMLGDVVETVGGLAGLRGGDVFAGPLAARIGGAGKGFLPGLARAGAYGLEGATIGAGTSAAGADTLEDFKRRALVGGALGGIVGGLAGPFANVTPKSAAVTPTEGELNVLGARDYTARDALPTSYNLDYVAKRAEDVNQALRNQYGRDIPRTSDYLSTIAQQARDQAAAVRAGNPNPPNPVAFGPSGAPNPAVGVASPRDINSLKREVYKAASRGGAEDRAAGLAASKDIENIITAPDPASFSPFTTPADAITAAVLHQRGRDNFSAAFRSKAVNDVANQINTRADIAGAGFDYDKALRTALDAASRKEKFAGFSPAENAAKEDLIRRSTKSAALRAAGNMLGGGSNPFTAALIGTGSLGGAATAYYFGQNPLYGALAGAGAATGGKILRSIGNRQARSAVDDFTELLRQRSPEYASRAAAAPIVPGPGLPNAARVVRNPLYFGGQTGDEIRDNMANILLGQQDEEQP